MTVTMYAQYQLLGRENIPAFREQPVADLKDYADKYVIEIPDNIPCWETEGGSYGVTIEGQKMLLSDVLTITGGKVAILYVDAKGLHKIPLNTVEGKQN